MNTTQKERLFGPQMSQKSPQKKKQKKREREKMYLMYYLNEDGKRVYTLKVRRDYYYRAFLSFFLSSLGETWRCLL